MAAMVGNRPNIVFIMADSLVTDAVGCYGSPFVRTPNIDALAGDGVLFENHYQTATTCLPARVSVLTGSYPPAHGVYSNSDRYDRSLPSALEYLSQNGYRGGHLGVLHCWGGTDRDGLQDWEHVDRKDDYVTNRDPEAEGPGTLKAYREHLIALGITNRAGHAKDFHHSAGYTDFPIEQTESRALSDKAIKCIDDFQEDRAQALWISYVTPHAPNVPPIQFLYDTRDVILPENCHDHGAGRFAHLHTGSLRNSFAQMEGETNLRRFWAAYAGDVTFLDDCIGRVLKRLKEQGQYDNTMIVVTADHGWIFGNHKWWGYGTPVLTDELLRVPLIMKLPGRHKAQRIPEVVSAVDIMPTLLEYAGIPCGDMDGRSLKGLIEGKPREDAYALGYHGNGCRDIVHDFHRRLSSRMLRQGKWKYILYNTNDYDELLDMENDPGECRNVADQFPAVKDQMRSKLLELIHKTDDPFCTRAPCDLAEDG